jgi:hypothetical protein
MKLEFKYGKLAIRGLNKMLYEDFTAFASTPKQNNKIKCKLSPKQRSHDSSNQPTKRLMSLLLNILNSKRG